MDSTSYLLRALLMRLPILLLFVAGVICAVITLRRHPKVSLLALLGLFAWQIESWTFTLINQRMPDWARAYGWSSANMAAIYFVINLTQDCLFSVALILLVTAALVGRGNRQTTYIRANT
jgi:hypothetical protein